MEFKVESKKIKVTMGDNAYEMKVPSVLKMRECQEKLSQAEPTKVLDVIVDYLKDLGLPQEVIMELDYDTFLDLYGFVNGAKKNSPATI